MKNATILCCCLIVLGAFNSYAQEKNSLGMLLTPIPAGSFHMGSHGQGEHYDEFPIHPVTITKPFLMGATEVTNAQYEQFDPSHKELRGKYGLSKGDDEAVIFVDYYEAEAFCKWLSKKEGKTYRLPTEAEWEYAAYGLIGNTQDERISNSRIYPWDGSWVRYAEKKHRGRMMANFTRGKGDYMGVAGSANDGWDYTSPVRSFWPNDFGLYDMAGNVNEWVADVYRTLSFQDMAEFNPYRGNVFQSPVLNEDGTAAPKDSLGRMRYRNQTDAELANRENYRTADNRNFNDGDLKSRISGDIDWRNTENDRGTHDMYYNDGKGEITTLIDDEARVYKGGSWKDRAYWLNPGSRRYMNQKRSSNDIGFRCAMSHVGNATGGKKNKVSQK